MKRILLLLALLSSQGAIAQHILVLKVKNADDQQALQGVTVGIRALHLGNITDSSGMAEIPGIPDGNYLLRFSRLGFETREIRYRFPRKNKDTLAVNLEPTPETLQGVVVSTTRTNSYLKDLPVRVEIIGSDDINEKIGSTPSNVSELLGEASGIQVLPTSAASGNVSVRIQGLEGRYTQLLKDGFPMYTGFSAGLSVLQIPPLDLQRVEIIKGASSALYGGDAIAGLVNFISKTPEKKTTLDFLLNVSQHKASDVSVYFSSRVKKFGVTLLATDDRQLASDIDHDGFTDLPKYETVTFNPKLFYYFNDSTLLSLSINTTSDSRIGGDIFAIQNEPDSAHPYVEHNISQRNYYQLKFKKHFPHGNVLTIKNSLSGYERKITIPGHAFAGTDINSYSEGSYLMKLKKNKFVFGLNLLSDHFRRNKNLSDSPPDYNFMTIGSFVQDDWEISKKLTAEAGLRLDDQNKYGFFPLPRAAFLYKITKDWSARIGGGLGYQIPTVFSTLSDQSDVSHIGKVGGQTNAVTSEGSNLDLNYARGFPDDFAFAYDQTFFITRINNPLIPAEDSMARGMYDLQNADGAETARGFESNFKFDVDDWEFIIDYTYTRAKNAYEPVHPNVPLNPQNKILLTLVYEDESNFRAGIEAYYSGRQYLSDGSLTAHYWTVDVLGEKSFEYFSLTGSIENIGDTRQSRFGPLVLPPYNHPRFEEIYAPLAGMTANLEVRIQL